MSRDIRLEYPDAKGYSVRNFKYMAKFAALFPEKEIVQEVLAQLSWYFENRLPAPQSELATQMMKDPYILTLSPSRRICWKEI